MPTRSPRWQSQTCRDRLRACTDRIGGGLPCCNGCSHNWDELFVWRRCKTHSELQNRKSKAPAGADSKLRKALHKTRNANVSDFLPREGNTTRHWRFRLMAPTHNSYRHTTGGGSPRQWPHAVLKRHDRRGVHWRIIQRLHHVGNQDERTMHFNFQFIVTLEKDRKGMFSFLDRFFPEQLPRCVFGLKDLRRTTSHAVCRSMALRRVKAMQKPVEITRRLTRKREPSSGWRTDATGVWKIAHFWTA